jgi:hypothetical protein
MELRSGWPIGRHPSESAKLLLGEPDMSTITRESSHIPLPEAGRGETIFGIVAVVVAVLAIIAKLSGLFA